LLIAGATALFAEYILSARNGQPHPNEAQATRRYILISVSLGVLCGGLFYLLRAETHFLGDGYALLSTLATETPLIKGRGLGEGLLHLWVSNLVGGPSESAALASYRMISIGSGLLFCAITTYLAFRIMDSLTKRVLLLVGIVSGGYALMFFGYVENYAVFLVSVLAFLSAGLLIVSGKLNRWWIVAPLLFALFFHLFGVSLCVPALYVLLHGSGLGNRIQKLSAATKLVLSVAIGGGLVAAGGYFYFTDLYVRLMILPIFSNIFVVDSYTLFSWRHLVDLVNLLFMLVPGILVLLPTFYFVWKSRNTRRPALLFLAIATFCAAGAIFIIDPKLGMTRDWDLLSFAGLPLNMLLFIAALSSTRNAVAGPVLAIALGLLSLLPRAFVLHSPERGLQQIEQYINLDPGRSRPALKLLGELSQKEGSRAGVDKWQNEATTRFPGIRLVYSAKNLSGQGNYLEAKRVLSVALKSNATFADAWLMLSQCYVNERNLDSALICARISDGLNPYNPATLEQMAFSYFMLQKYDQAEEIWLAQSKRDSAWSNPLYGLACIAKRKGDAARYQEYLIKAVSKSDAPPQFSMELADHYLASGQIRPAAAALQQAQQRGLNPKLIEERVSRYPQLKQWLGQ
jgi:hypothetical protein